MVDERKRLSKEKGEDTGGRRRKTEASKDDEVLNEFVEDATEDGYFHDVVLGSSSSSADVNRIE
eukprot:152234-Karenia_brevis.AAC.1